MSQISRTATLSRSTEFTFPRFPREDVRRAAVKVAGALEDRIHYLSSRFTKENIRKGVINVARALEDHILVGPVIRWYARGGPTGRFDTNGQPIHLGSVGSTMILADRMAKSTNALFPITNAYVNLRQGEVEKERVAVLAEAVKEVARVALYRRFPKNTRFHGTVGETVLMFTNTYGHTGGIDELPKLKIWL